MVKIHELVKIGLQPRVAFSLWLTALVILVAPLPEFLNVDESVTQYNNLIKLVGLFAFIVWVVEAVLFGWERLSVSASGRATKEEVLAHLETLNPNETFVLARHIFLERQTVQWGKGNGEIASLVAKGLLESVLRGNHVGNAPFTIPRFVWDHLQGIKTQFIEEAKMVVPDKASQLSRE